MARQFERRRGAAVAAAAALLGLLGACSKGPGAQPAEPTPAPAEAQGVASADKASQKGAGAAPAAASPEQALAAKAPAPAGPAAAPASAPAAEAGEPEAAWDPKEAYRQAEGPASQAKGEKAPAQNDQDGAADKAVKADPSTRGAATAAAAEEAPAGGDEKAKKREEPREALAPADAAKDSPPSSGAAAEPAKPTAKSEAKSVEARPAIHSRGGEDMQAQEPPVAPLQLARRSTGGGGKAVLQRSRPAPRSSDRQLRLLPPPPSDYPRDARYRSTYLPGRGYLQHLQAAIAKSGPGLPSAAQAVQAPRPSLPEPENSAIKVAIDLSRQQVSEQGGEIAVRVRLRSARQPPHERLPLRLHLVIDSSGSMKGQPWQQVCAAMHLLAQRLEPRDQLSVTLFSEQAWVMAAPASGGPLLEELAKKVCTLKPRGETNTFAGLQLGYQQARGAYAAEAVNRVLLLSDGMATVGPREPYEITADTARALGQGITTSGLGIGRDFDALLMNRIALEGGGNHHFVRDAAALPAVLMDELEVLRQQAAEALDIRLALAPDVRLIEVVGSEPLGVAESLRARQVEVAADRRIAREQAIAANRQRDFDGGVRFFLPAFRAGDEHAFVLRVAVPPGQGQHEVARVVVRYKDLIHKKNAGFVGGRTVQHVAPEQLAQTEAEADVQLTAARLKAGYALQRASEYLDGVNLPAIRAELYAAALALQNAADASGSALAQAESARMQALADSAQQALRDGHERWLASVFHYHWRMSGATAWTP